jgi:L-malate glycosyltransferase
MISICFLADGQSIHTKRWCSYFVDRGYDVHLVTFRNAELPGVNVHFIDSGEIHVEGNNKKILLKVPEIKRLLKKIKPDIVHAHYATSYGLIGALCSIKPFVVTALGSDVLISPFQNALYKKALKYVFRKADRITAMSDPMKDVMISLGADPQKISTVIFGIDPEVFNANGRIDSESNFTIASTRNFEPVYNIDLLIKALAIVKSEIPALRVEMTGVGSMEKKVNDLISDLQLESIITLHGKVTQHKIADLLRQSQLFVSVSSSDGNNISLNEAMACGCFSVASDIPANRQWIEEGTNGYFCKGIHEKDIAEAIIKAYTTYKEKREGSRKFNDAIIKEKALWSENMKKVEYLYAKLLANEK